MSLVGGLQLNYGKVVIVDLEQCGVAGVESHSMRFVDYDERWRAAQFREGGRYLGYHVGLSGTSAAWLAPLQKMLHRAELIPLLRLGAPASLQLAKSVLWSCCTHLLGVFAPPHSAVLLFRELFKALLRGPPGWLRYEQAVHLEHVGWRWAPPHIHALSLPSRIRTLCRMELWHLPQLYAHAVSCIRSEDAPLSPLLLAWFNSSMISGLKEAAEAAVHGGLLTLQNDGSLCMKARLERAICHKSSRASLLKKMLSAPGGALFNGAVIARQWVDRRVVMTHGRDLASFSLITRYLRHLRTFGRHGPPKILNAMMRVITGGVVIRRGDERCVACWGCLGRNDLRHYASSLCWMGPVLRHRFSLRFSIIQRLTCTPEREFSIATAWMCYWLVKGLNLTRFVFQDSRPELPAEYMYRLL